VPFAIVANASSSSVPHSETRRPGASSFCDPQTVARRSETRKPAHQLPRSRGGHARAKTTVKTDSRALPTGYANRPERCTQQQSYGLRLNTAGSVPCSPARCSFDWRSFVAVGAAIGHLGCTMLLSDDDLARARREQPVQAIDSEQIRADVNRAAGDARALSDAGPDASVQSSPPGVVVISVD